MPSSDGLNPVLSALWRGAAVLLALAGVAGFAWLFAREMNLYWFILSPLILAIYEIPAVVVFALWKRARRRGEAGRAAEAEEPEDAF